MCIHGAKNSTNWPPVQIEKVTGKAAGSKVRGYLSLYSKSSNNADRWKRGLAWPMRLGISITEALLFIPFQAHKQLCARANTGHLYLLLTDVCSHLYVSLWTQTVFPAGAWTVSTETSACSSAASGLTVRTGAWKNRRPEG